MAAGTLRVSFNEQDFAILRMQKGENRINTEFISAFNKCLDQVESNQKCKGLITTGEGKFYCNGLDLKWLSQQGGSAWSRLHNDLSLLMTRILTFPLPTIAAINGHAFAGGALLAFSHDLTVMNSQKGWICFNEIFLKMRLPASWLKLVRSRISPQEFNKMMVFGHRFTGLEAERLRIIDKAVQPVLLEKESQRLLASWRGKEGFDRESLRKMKVDVYADVITALNESKL